MLMPKCVVINMDTLFEQLEAGAAKTTKQEAVAAEEAQQANIESCIRQILKSEGDEEAGRPNYRVREVKSGSEVERGRGVHLEAHQFVKINV